MKINDLFHVRMAFAIVTLTLAGGAVRADSAAPVETATAISKVPYVITKPGVYLVKKDLVLASATGVAITITALDVTLDLGGHAVSCGAPKDNNNGTVGVAVLGTTQEFIVRNGILRGFFDGVEFAAAGSNGRAVVENLAVEDCIRLGIYGTASEADVHGCHVLDLGFPASASAPQGIVVIGKFVKVTGNVVGNVDATLQAKGIVCTSSISALLERNVVSNVATGFMGMECDLSGGGIHVVQNSVTNFTTGIYMNSPGVKYRANLTSACSTPFSGGTAIGADNN